MKSDGVNSKNNPQNKRTPPQFELYAVVVSLLIESQTDLHLELFFEHIREITEVKNKMTEKHTDKSLRGKINTGRFL
ncbi:MAG: hypothetical protein LBU77_03285 [Clostridiales bacterium]|nr:hypothetical protein [Clostridiales bacterium]